MAQDVRQQSYAPCVRMTITLEDDVAAEIERLRRVRRLSPSEAINELARRGMARRPEKAAPSVPQTAPLGLRMDVSDIGAMLDILDEVDDNGQGEQRQRSAPETA